MEEVTPRGATLWADEHVYFLTGRAPAEGTEVSYAEVIELQIRKAGVPFTSRRVANKEMFDLVAAEFVPDLTRRIQDKRAKGKEGQGLVVRGDGGVPGLHIPGQEGTEMDKKTGHEKRRSRPLEAFAVPHEKGHVEESRGQVETEGCREEARAHRLGRRSVEYTEIIELTNRVLPVDIHLLHMGSFGSPPAPSDKLLNPFFLSFTDDLHSAVRQVSHPPFQTEVVGLLSRIVTEVDTLDNSGNHYSRSLIHRFELIALAVVI